MNKIVLIASVVIITGCTAIPTDMFPKFTWYWSKDAKEYRASKHRQENNYDSSTNQFTNPR
jgi:hypothetical protein